MTSKINFASILCNSVTGNAASSSFVEEAIANAVRHANADRISVRAELLPSQQVRFSIINNGSSTDQDSIGMGTAWLNHHAPNSWSRSQSENGIELTITL